MTAAFKVGVVMRMLFEIGTLRSLHVMMGTFWPASWPTKRFGFPFKTIGSLLVVRRDGTNAIFEIG
jgi:hypothetical protein